MTPEQLSKYTLPEVRIFLQKKKTPNTLSMFYQRFYHPHPKFPDGLHVTITPALQFNIGTTLVCHPFHWYFIIRLTETIKRQ